MPARQRFWIFGRRTSDRQPAPRAALTPWAQSLERNSVRDAAQQRALRQRPS